MRIGIGYDIHQLAFGQKLVLGGVRIEFGKGPRAWSDGDVLAHAVIDAILGAAGLGDVGHHFPDGDERWKDAQGLDMLERTAKILTGAGYKLINIDATIFLEQPKIGPQKKEMAANVAKALGLPPYQVNVKAGTMEGMGPVGEGNAIAAQAVALADRQT